MPWNVNGSGDQVPDASVTAYNENASALDQVALTRDTALGFAWVDRQGVVQVWDRDRIDATVRAVLGEDDYTELDLSFSTGDAINEVLIRVQNAAGLDTVETVYGPYRDSQSIATWGRFSKEFTVTGLDAAGADALGAAILAASATPRVRANSLTLPVLTAADVAARATIDLYDLFTVSNTSKGVSDDLRVTGVEHTIASDKWLAGLSFSAEGGVAAPTVQPPVQAGTRPDVGVVELFGGPASAVPAGKILCDGRSVLVADYPYLFAVIGYAHGGSGASFNVPNLVDRFPVGAGTKALGTSGGAATKAIGVANLPAHSHGAGTLSTSSSGNHDHGITYSASTGSSKANLPRGTGTQVDTGTGAVLSDGFHSHGVTGSTGDAGSGTPLDVMNPWRALNFVIRAV